MSVHLRCALCSLAILTVAHGAEYRVRVEFAGGTHQAQLHWDGQLVIEHGKLLGIENAGLDGGGEGWRDQTETSVKLKAMTEGGADGVVLTIEGTPQTIVRYDTPVLPLQATIADILRRTVKQTGDHGAWIAMSLAAVGKLALPTSECSTPLLDQAGTLWTIGIQNTGDLTAQDTLQVAVLGKFDGEQWTKVEQLAGPGYVYFTTGTVLPDGTFLLAWNELRSQTWQTWVTTFDPKSGKPAEPQQLSTGRVNLNPAVYAGPEGTWCAWQTADGAGFSLVARQLNGTLWSAPIKLPKQGVSDARAVLAGDGQAVWLAFDAFVGRDYDVYVSRLANGQASMPQPVLASNAEEMSPQLCRGTTGTVWLLAANKLVGLRTDGFVKPQAWPQKGSPVGLPLVAVTTDPKGGLWVVGARLGGRNAAPSTRAALLTGDRLIQMPPFPAEPAWAAPLLAVDGGVRTLTKNALLTGSGDTVSALAEIATEPLPPPDEKTVEELERPARATLELDGKPYNLYYGELHTHLGENPADRTIREWVDRYYLRSRYDIGLDIGATSDHDWPAMTITKYMVQQGVASALNQDGQYLAYSGFEWSGDGAVRKAYGDRTVVFANDYTPIARITDEVGNQPQKLHAWLKQRGGIDWPHHVGASWAMMDWSTHDAEIEPVVEITSSHGVYETYDLAHVIAGWTKTPVGDRHAPIQPGAMQQGKVQPRQVIGQQDYTSLQYGLSQGHQFAFVGSSDSHSGISGYQTGMLAVYAPELTRAAILDAWRARRVYAIRGGRPLAVKFSVGGAFMGRSIQSKAAPRLVVEAHGSGTIDQIEVVRNNQYVYVKPGNGTADLSFTYEDQAAPKGRSYYYLRVYQAGDEYAWASPVWVDRG